MGELALDPKPAPAVLPVRHAHPLAANLGRVGVHGEGHVLLQGVELLVGLGLERVGEHTAAGAGGVQGRRGELGTRPAGGRQKWRREGGGGW